MGYFQFDELVGPESSQKANLISECKDHPKNNWAVLSDEQMRKIWPFSLLNDEQMSNKVEVKHQPDKQPVFHGSCQGFVGFAQNLFDELGSVGVSVEISPPQINGCFWFP